MLSGCAGGNLSDYLPGGDDDSSGSSQGFSLFGGGDAVAPDLGNDPDGAPDRKIVQ